MTDRELMALQADTLFTHDAAGRMVAINEADGAAAPRVFLGMTASGIVVRLRHDLPPPLAAALQRLAAAEPPSADLRALPGCFPAMRAELERYAAIQTEGFGPAFRFPDTLPPSGSAVEITPDNAPAVAARLPWLRALLSREQPCFVIIEEGAAVACCHSARRTARAAEAGVETLPEYRGRGYAVAVTAAWAAAVRRQGLFPFYSASWDNVASQGVARRLGLLLFGADLHLT